MARVKLVGALHVGSVRLKAGSTIADSAGAAQTGDFVWTGLTSATWNPIMSPLDGPATTMKAASQYASAGVPATISGAQSVDA
jgi:hypothetical protein